VLSRSLLRIRVTARAGIFRVANAVAFFAPRLSPACSRAGKTEESIFFDFLAGRGDLRGNARLTGGTFNHR